MSRWLIASVLLVGLIARLEAASYGPQERLPVPESQGSYLVVMDGAGYSDPAWRGATDTLRRKHDAGLAVVPVNQVEAVLPTLRRLRPRYVCFVFPPDRIGRKVVARIHRLMRQVDGDPYCDATWAILTGYDAADAARIAKRAEPLVVRSGFSSMGPGLAKALGAGFASSETDAGAFWTIDAEGNAQKRDVAPDPTAALAEAFKTIPVQMMVTSGHATERDWQIGYNVRAGDIRCEKGRLYARSTDGTRHFFDSPHPKVYLPMGNCLIGHVPKQDCMATAWMHSGGVHQMYGYTAVTFYGFMGWGVGTYFSNGALNLAQAFHANSHALIHKLHAKYRHQSGITLSSLHQSQIQKQARLNGIGDRDLLGLLWDRDAVVFYGDPAWDARRSAGNRGWSVSIERGDEHRTSNGRKGKRAGDAGEAKFALTVRTAADGKWPNRPLVVPFTTRLEDVRVTDSSDGILPVIADDFALLPLTGAYTSNTEIRVEFVAQVAEQPRTSKGTRVIRLDELKSDDIGSAGVKEALLLAGEHRVELQRVLSGVPAAQRPAAEFLVANMPTPDLHALPASLLTEHIALAWTAWKESPWAASISEELFMDAVLPYASVDEARELWIPGMRKRCLPLVAGCKTPGEAALALNEKLFKLVNVSYHGSKRPKPNQNPSESIAASYASCTGLSILLVDACRSVGVPARIVGVPQWSHSRGNHTWVEVWDGGDWQPIGAAESHKLGDVWFRDAAAKANPGHRLTRIYATQWKRGETRFPLVWNLGYEHVSAVDVTTSYSAAKKD